MYFEKYFEKYIVAFALYSNEHQQQKRQNSEELSLLSKQQGAPSRMAGVEQVARKEG